MQHFSAERACLQNPCASQFVQLEESRALVPGDRVVGLRRFHQVQQVTIRRVGSMMPARQWTIPQIGPVEVIQHRSNLIWVDQGAHLRIAAGNPDLIDLVQAGDQAEPSTKPSIVNRPRCADGKNQCAKKCCYRAGRSSAHSRPSQANDSSIAASSTSGATPAFFSMTD
jgi:hypothetical protein